MESTIRMVSAGTCDYKESSMSFLILPLFQFLIRYRRTALGPLWLVVSPALFIATLGHLYAAIGAAEAAVFIPHLTVGYILWSLIASFVQQSPTIYQRNRAQILQGGLTLEGIVAVDAVTWVLSFAHQLPIILVVFVIYRIPVGWEALESIVGLGIIVANGLWVTRVFGILGARYRDLTEIVQAVMRIAFLATPIIWIPGSSGRGGLMGHFLMWNPFFHFIEVVRAPLLGQHVALVSWLAVIGFTVVGYGLAHLMTLRYARQVPLWV